MLNIDTQDIILNHLRSINRKDAFLVRKSVIRTEREFLSYQYSTCKERAAHAGIKFSTYKRHLKKLHDDGIFSSQVIREKNTVYGKSNKIIGTKIYSIERIDETKAVSGMLNKIKYKKLSDKPINASKMSLNKMQSEPQKVSLSNISKKESTNVDKRIIEHSTICPTVSNFDLFKADLIKKIKKELNLDDDIVKRIADNEWKYVESNPNIKNKRAYFKVSLNKECEKARSYLSDGGKYFFADERKAYIEAKKVKTVERKVAIRKEDYKLPYAVPNDTWDESWDPYNILSKKLTINEYYV